MARPPDPDRPNAPPSARDRRAATLETTRHFRVFIDEEEIGIAWISRLQLLDTDRADPHHPSTVTLARAIDHDRRLHDWRRGAAAGDAQPRTVEIFLLDRPNGKPRHGWTLDAAVPVRWTGPGFDALSGGLAMEEIELAYRTILWQAQPRLPGTAGRP